MSSMDAPDAFHAGHCSSLRVLVACEYSGAVRDAFTALGHEAMSCDLLPTDQPGSHYQGDVRDVMEYPWDLMIAHPPCTHLSVSGAKHFQEKRKDGRQKATCLWLKNLPPLKPTEIVEGREARIHKMPPSAARWKLRSATYAGIDRAMAEQWGGSFRPTNAGMTRPHPTPKES